MPVQAAQPLEHQIDRRQISHHEVEVHVQRLLNHLGGNHDVQVRTVRTALRRPEAAQQVSVTLGAVAGQEAGVVDGDPVRPELLGQPLSRFLHPDHRVTHHRRAPTTSKMGP
jgi:hypothetical protein